MKKYLGIEFGSTRIKGTVIDESFTPVASGDYVWKSDLKDGIWTYDLAEAETGLKKVLSDIKGVDGICSVGISGMMHGYLAFDKDWNLLTPFRTWQNTITAESSKSLTELFEFNIPQRWSIAHLYQAILNGEGHIKRIAHITTLAGYIHYRLTGVNAVGVGEASGIFPIDSNKLCYDEEMLKKFSTLMQKYNMPWNIADILPEVLLAGENAGYLTESGAELTNNMLSVGTSFAPPEGDAGTGMVATNSVAEKTGNISAGTSIFSMIVLEKGLKKVYEEIDMVTTPSGRPVAMVHCNNCTADSNAWISVFGEVAALFGNDVPTGKLYTRLYEKSLEGEADCGGVYLCNYLAGEVITHLDEGRPMVLRHPESNFNLANLLRSMLYSAMATLRLGMDILKNEDIKIECLNGHGGLFKTPIVGQKYMSAALDTPVTVTKTSGEGGPYGMALLAAFSADTKGQTLEAFLKEYVFKNAESSTVNPEKKDIEGFDEYMKGFKKLLELERKAIKEI